MRGALVAKLNPKQTRFVAEYLIDSNATQAAIRAGYSAKTAKAIGHENLTKPDIAAAIAAGQAKIAGRLEITAEKVLRDIEDVRVKAMADASWPAALRASELQGKTIKGLFTDGIDLNATTKSLDEKPASVLEMARELAFALALGMRQAPPSESPDTPTTH